MVDQNPPMVQGQRTRGLEHQTRCQDPEPRGAGEAPAWGGSVEVDRSFLGAIGGIWRSGRRWVWASIWKRVVQRLLDHMISEDSSGFRCFY